MKPLLPLVALLLLSSSPYHAPAPQSPRDPIVNLSVYEVAELATGAPASILQGIARVESGEKDDAIGDDGVSIGRFQINETWHASHAFRFGAYDPRNAEEAAVLTGRLYMANLAELGDPLLAIAAHRQGARGVRIHGPDTVYVGKVLRGSP